MALTEDQKSRVRMYLGYERNRDIYPHLESKFDLFNATEETLVGEILVELAALRTAMSSSVSGNSDGVASVSSVSSSITFRSTTSLTEAQNTRGRALVSRLEAMFGVTRRIEFFGEGGCVGGVIRLG